MVELEKDQPTVINGEVIRVAIKDNPLREIATRCSECHMALNIGGVRADDDGVMLFIKPDHKCPIINRKHSEKVMKLWFDPPLNNTRDLSVCTGCSTQGGVIIMDRHNYEECSNEIRWFENEQIKFKAQCQKCKKKFRVDSEKGLNVTKTKRFGAVIDCPECKRGYGFYNGHWISDRLLKINL